MIVCWGCLLALVVAGAIVGGIFLALHFPPLPRKPRSLMAPLAKLPDDYRLPSTAPIPENPEAWVVAPEPELTEADIIVGLDFAGVEHLIQWCRTHDYSVRPQVGHCWFGHQHREPCRVIDAMLRLVPDGY